MPDKMPREEEQAELDCLLTEMAALISGVVPKACHGLGYHPGEAELDGVKQDLFVMLRENDYHVLRSFRREAEPSTWLFRIARRQIQRRLEKERTKVNYDVLPPDYLTTEANQEEEVLQKEERALLARAAIQLNQKEQELLGMMLVEKKTEEIAQALGKSENATNAQKSRVTAKLRKILTSLREKGRP
ncbi:MAG: RNA polymerase sigma factor [Terriglobia bacterium]